LSRAGVRRGGKVFYRSDLGSNHGTSQRCIRVHIQNSTSLDVTGTASQAKACMVSKLKLPKPNCSPI